MTCTGSEVAGVGIGTQLGDVEVSGGTLTATGPSYGVQANGGDVKVSGGKVVATGTNMEGIVASKYEFQEGQPVGCNVTISGGTVEATGKVYGILASGGDVTISGTATGTSVTVSGGDKGISVEDGDVTVSGGTVVATGNSDYSISTSKAAAQRGGDVTISGTVDSTDVTATGLWSGINSSKGVTIDGGKVVATATADVEASGIRAVGDVQINGGDVTAQGKTCITTQGAVTLGEGVSVKAGDDEASAKDHTADFATTYTDYPWARTVKAATYTVAVDGGIQNGTVSVDKTEAAEGDTVKVTARAAEGYELDTVTVKDSDGKRVETKDGSFTMPASDVTVSATFTKKPGPEPAPAPAKPAKVAAPSTVAHVAAGSIDVSWKKAKGAKSYQVQWRVAGAKKWSTATMKGTKKTITGLRAGKLYDVRVRGVDGSAEGAWSTPARQRWLRSVSKAKAKPGTSKGSVKVSWKKDKSANAGYKVLVYARRGDKPVTSKVVSKSKASATITNLKSGKTYYVRVRPLKSRSGKTYAGALCGYRSAVAK